MKIKSINARAVLAPMPRPITTASGIIPKAPLVLIDVLSNEGITGSAYIFAYTELTLKPLVEFVKNIEDVISGQNYAPYDILENLRQKTRLLGSQGLVGMAINGIEMALWDGLGKHLNHPVVTLLGGQPKPIPAYDSFGLVNSDKDIDDITQSVKNGFKGIKIKVGAAELDHDIETISKVRKAIGPDIALMIDYNQSLSSTEAITRLKHLKEFDLEWVEEPVLAEDLVGHARVSAKSGCAIQTGENWWYPEGLNCAIQQNACDFAMLDLRKIGGISGWIQAAALAKANSLPVSSHLFIEASAHCLAVTQTSHWLEWMDIASAVIEDPLTLRDGMAYAKGPGLAINWDLEAVNKYAA